MNTRELETALAAADPVDQGRLDGLELETMEAELLADLDGEQPALPPIEGDLLPRRRSRRLGLALGAAALAAIAAIVLLGGGASQRPSRAYGADLVRFAESSPLLLLEGPDWRVEDVNEERRREGIEGSVEFATGKPISSEPILVTKTGQYEIRRPPASARQRQVQLSWHIGPLKTWLEEAHRGRPGRWTTVPVLGTTAHVDTRAEIYEGLGGPGDREMIALWAEDGHVLEVRAAVPDLGAFEERLGWLTKVDLQTWLAAMPPNVVKAGDHDATVREMLKGIPVPSTFKPSRVPDEGLITDRSRVAGEVTATVSCLWFRQWGNARRTGDRGAALEAEQAMETAPRWPIVRQTEREGSSFETLLKLVKSMPTGIWQFGPHRWRVLPKAEGLGCARLGIPVLPWKMKRQRERGVPLPPR
jgi:hypothetical protein